MNKQELGERIAAKDLGLSKVKAVKVVEAVFKEIESALEAGEETRIPSFGRFWSKTLKTRRFKNPRTGQPLDKEVTVVKFSPSPLLKQVVRCGD